MSYNIPSEFYKIQLGDINRRVEGHFKIYFKLKFTLIILGVVIIDVNEFFCRFYAKFF